MELLREVQKLMEIGLFRDALRLIETRAVEGDARLAVKVARAELLERVGRTGEARALVFRLLEIKNLSVGDRLLCDFILARLYINDGNLDSAVAHLHKCIGGAQRTGDLERLCWAQLKLLFILGDGESAEAIGPLLAEVRANVARSGNARLLAALHIYVGQIEARRSLIASARRHTRRALGILAEAPNAWLEAAAENIELATSIMASDLEGAEIHGRRGLELADRSGGATEYAVNQANLGFLCLVLGRFEEATVSYERTLTYFSEGSPNYNGTLESLARVRLAEGRLDECEALLAQIDQSVHSQKDRLAYVYRHQQLTRAQVAALRGRASDALDHATLAIDLARETSDRLLLSTGLATKAEVLFSVGEVHEAAAILVQLSKLVADQPLSTYALYERLLANASRGERLTGPSHDHFSRSERIYRSLGHRQGLAELSHSYGANSGSENPALITNGELQSYPSASPTTILHSVAALLLHGTQSEFAARELVEILAATDCVISAVAISRSPTGEEKILSRVSTRDSSPIPTSDCRLTVAVRNGHTTELALQLKSDVESIANLNAVSTLMSVIQELECGRTERLEKTTMWSIEELPYDAKHAISGHMRELMTFAQRVARTTVNVLITGESGTGKEILARAVHAFSDRAQKPFVPLNCAAVPRDLLESQLFGHRRGAFTGADRDQLGLIPSAADGTLFLDEIAEMSLDLQPKLLRFLESGEIAPLGHHTTSTVNVRVIAATNANLQDAVRDGRFREDLFYRLNVVPLAIRPLRERRDEIPGMITHFVAAAALEYKKGYLEVAEETLERLLLYRWPGNVRQLQNEIRRMVALAEPNSTLEPAAISKDIIGAIPYLRPPANSHEIAVPLRDKLLPTLMRIECEMIKTALRDHHGRMEPAAKSLGISRKGLYLKRRRLGL